MFRQNARWNSPLTGWTPELRFAWSGLPLAVQLGNEKITWSNMSEIDQLYQSAIDQMSMKQRVARSVELFNWSREFIGRQIKAENPTASIERLKLLVALRMYGSEPGMRKLLESMLANVPD